MPKKRKIIGEDGYWPTEIGCTCDRWADGPLMVDDGAPTMYCPYCGTELVEKPIDPQIQIGFFRAGGSHENRMVTLSTLLTHPLFTEKMKGLEKKDKENL